MENNLNLKTIVFITINIKNNKFFIGTYETDHPLTFDGFIGEDINIFNPKTYKNSRTEFQYDVNAYGVKNFKRITIGIFNNQQDAEVLYNNIVNNIYILPNTYNKRNNNKVKIDNNTKIYFYNLDGTFYREYNSLLECAREFGDKTISKLVKATKLGRIYNNYQTSFNYVNSMRNIAIDESPKKVDQFDLDGNFIKTYDTITKAILDHGIGVRSCIRGQRNQTHGYVFKLRS